jgi:hypothetical protein
VVSGHDQHGILIIETVKFGPQEREVADTHAASPGAGNDLLDPYVARLLAGRREVADLKRCRRGRVYLLVPRPGIADDDSPEHLVPPHYIVKSASKGLDVHLPGYAHGHFRGEQPAESPGFISQISATQPLLRT